mmetsp:Transcript_22760/g.37696  ORF Transcript_22760/g.37696 Transcript_22760/m.37696 type:complete len:375 (-) Transcript_22760:52-1176(-)
MKAISVLVLAPFVVFSSAQTARNVRVTSDGLIIATQATGGLLVQRGTNTPTEILFPSSRVTNFDDIAVDDSDFLFALSTNSRTICSYFRNSDSFSFVGCVSPGFAVSPFSGVSARGGVCVVSGGTGGMTVIEYSQDTGVLDSNPRFLNAQLPNVVGFPDVELLNGNLAAMSTDFRDGLPRFGTMLVNLESAEEIRNFRVADSLRFDLFIGSTNFPVVNAFYGSDNGQTYMYTANGGMTVQYPTEPDSTVVIDAPAPLGNSFRAVTLAVDQQSDVMVVGGLLNGVQSVILRYDISESPLDPLLLSTSEVAGRITSVASNSGVVSYVGAAIDGRIGLLDEVAASDFTPPKTGVPDSSGYAISFSFWFMVVVVTCWV